MLNKGTHGLNYANNQLIKFLIKAQKSCKRTREILKFKSIVTKIKLYRKSSKEDLRWH
jgi:hypothetical protein